MRRAAFGLLVATTLGGCNQIFGLEATTSIPDAPDAPPLDSAWASIHLGFLQQTFDPSGTVPPPIETPFPDLVTVEVGPSEGPLVTRPSENGIVTIPPDISAGPFRLVYQRQGDTIREYQGLVPDAHVIEALFGPVTRVPPPVGAGFAITPTNYTGNHLANRVFTVGTWTEGARVPGPASGALLTYDYEAAITASMSGALGATAATDRGVLVDYAINGYCRSAVGSTDFPGGPLTTAHQPVGGPWSTSTANPLTTSETDDMSVDFNPEWAQFGELNVTPKQTTENYGFVPSALMPAFTRPPDGLRQVALPNPVMLVLRSCTALDTDAAVHEPTLFSAKLARALYTEASVRRTVAGGVTVNSGVAVISYPVLVFGMPKFDVRTVVAFPVDVKLTSATATVSLMGTDDAPIPATAGTVTLAWSKYKTTELVDFWEVTLGVIDSSSNFIKKRIYTTTTPDVRIEGSELHAGERYLLQITGHLGRPNAGAGDYRTVQGAQAISVFYPRTFVVVP
jgi:hypothetical protein